MKKPWTREELEYLKSNYNSNPSAIAKQLGRTTKSVIRKASDLNLVTVRKDWTVDRIGLLVENYYHVDNRKLAKLLDCSKQTIENKVRELGLTLKKRYWTTEEDDILKEWYGKLSYVELSALTNRPVAGVDKRLRKLGIQNPRVLNTTPELQVENILKGLGKAYLAQVKLYTGIKDACNRDKYIQPDFLIGNKIIEVQGDFFHCNPSVYLHGPIHSLQIRNLQNDLAKKQWYGANGYVVLWLWEADCKDTTLATQIISDFLCVPQVSNNLMQIV